MGGQDACEICPVGGLWAAIDSLSEFSALALYTMPTKKEGERGDPWTPLDPGGNLLLDLQRVLLVITSLSLPSSPLLIRKALLLLSHMKG